MSKSKTVANTPAEINKALRLITSPRGATRAKRRTAGNYAPVNTAASLEQAPDGRYAKSLTQAKKAAKLAAVTSES